MQWHIWPKKINIPVQPVYPLNSGTHDQLPHCHEFISPVCLLPFYGTLQCLLLLLMDRSEVRSEAFFDVVKEPGHIFVCLLVLNNYIKLYKNA